MLLGGRHASGNGSPPPYLLISVCLFGGAVAGADAGADAGAADCCWLLLFCLLSNLVGSSLVWSGLLWYGLIWCGLVWPGIL